MTEQKPFEYRSCMNCQHYSCCAWRRAQHDLSSRFLKVEDIEILHKLYDFMGMRCQFFLAPVQEPAFKDNWFKIAATTYEDEVKRLVADGMPEENARLVAFREAVLAAVQSEDFLSLARQVPILEAKLAEYETRPQHS